MSVEGADPAPASTPPAWDDPRPDRPIPFWAAIRADLVAHVPPERRRMSRRAWAWTAIRTLALSSGLHVTLCYRAAHALRPRLYPAGRAASAAIFWMVRHLYGCAIAPSSRLHAGLMLPHPQGIVVGPGVVVGPRCYLFHNVTIGGAPGRPGFPRVGSDARIYAGAVLSGPILVGDNVMVGANVVVSRDVPARSAVRPAAAEVAPLPERFLSSGE